LLGEIAEDEFSHIDARSITAGVIFGGGSSGMTLGGLRPGMLILWKPLAFFNVEVDMGGGPAFSLNLEAD
jgi:hypothetical protein